MANKNSEILKNWFLTIRPIDRKQVFKRLYEETLASPTTLNNWRYGSARIPLAAMRDINKVTKEYSGYEIFEIVRPEASAEA